MYRRNVLKSISILVAAFLLLLAYWPTSLPVAATSTSIPTSAAAAASSSVTTSSVATLNETFLLSPDQLQAIEIFDSDNNDDQQISPRSFICVPLFRLFNVELTPADLVSLASDESLAVSGDHPALGHWQLAKAVPLQPQNKARSRWRLRMWICASQRFYYRYLIYSTSAQGKRILRRWEGQQVGRMMQTYEMYRSPGLDIFGEAYPRSVGGGRHVERGWLQHEYIVELKFVWQQHLVIAGAAPAAKYHLQLTTLGLVESALIEVSRYAYNHSAFRRQQNDGVRYCAGCIVIFRVSQALHVSNVFRLAIGDEDNNAVGEAYIFPADLCGSRGILQLPIFAPVRNLQVGTLTLPYLIVQPLPSAAAGNLRVSFQRYWPSNWPTMDVGRRGLGASYTNADTRLVENTIESLLAVLKAKGDMALLDVQLTRDYVPVLWNGFGFYTTTSTESRITRLDLRYVLIRQLSYAELKASRIFKLQRWELQEYSYLNVMNASQPNRLFPKLSEIFEALPRHLGLIVEVKWPQLMQSGFSESTQTLNKNTFVDKLIETTARHGCGRPLIFASFDADICTMLRLKQHVFPVMLMSIGNSSTWDWYMDLRTQSVRQAINFAESAELLGTALHVKNFLGSKQQLLALGLDLHQAVFVWGGDLRNVQLLEHLRALDVSGLIYDQIETFGPADWKRAPFFQAQQLMEMFGGQCVAIGNSSTVPHAKPVKPTVWPKMR